MLVKTMTYISTYAIIVLLLALIIWMVFEIIRTEKRIRNDDEEIRCQKSRKFYTTSKEWLDEYSDDLHKFFGVNAVGVRPYDDEIVAVIKVESEAIKEELALVIPPKLGDLRVIIEVSEKSELSCRGNNID